MLTSDHAAKAADPELVVKMVRDVFNVVARDDPAAVAAAEGLLRAIGVEPRYGMMHALFESVESRLLLAKRDVAGVFRHLQRHGISQRRIAAATGQSQSEISEILAGRVVTSYEVLLRVCDGIGVPRGWMGLAYDEEMLGWLSEQDDPGAGGAR